MRRKIIPLALSAMLFAPCHPVEAQQAIKVSRVGLLTGISSAGMAAREEAFRQGMRQLGYAESKSFVMESRYADGQTARLNELAVELTRLEPNVFVTGGSQATRATKNATTTIPIIMANDNDPVGDGFVKSLARPGGNITGLTNVVPDISGKQLELLKEVIPRLSRLAVIGDATVPNTAQLIVETKRAGAAIGVQVVHLEVRTIEDAETVFRDATKARAEAALVLPGAVLGAKRNHVATLAVKSRLPAIYPRAEYVDDGGLMTYSANNLELFRRAATYVDKILKGASPAELPVEQPKKFELVINLKAAKQIGLTIPPNVLARADRVIR
jgi:putative ABC transport system substrate-binding protein